TRHNLGADVVTHLSVQLGVKQGLDGWKQRSFCRYLNAQHESTSFLLILPQKFMNLSGEAAVPLLRYFKVEPSRMIVVHDELDLEPGVIRLKLGGSAGGHNGVSDIIRCLGTEEFFRVRVGVGHPRRGNEPAKGEGPGKDNKTADAVGYSAGER